MSRSNPTRKKVILVTGASSGIGKATVRRLLRDGHTVYGAARRLDNMRDIEQIGAIILKMDITNDQEILNVVECIDREQGGLDVLVNNAGYTVTGPIELVSIDEARRQFEVNLFGLGRLTQLVLPGMRRNGSGRIINVSSVGGRTYTPLSGWYHATKYALEGWSDCLRLEVAEFGIEVVIIEPGGVKTEFDPIMTEGLRTRAKGSVYQTLADGMIEAAADAEKKMSSPDVIADTITDAIRAKRPRTRYAAGYMARSFLLIRSLLTDRMFDTLLMSMAKNLAARSKRG